MTFEAQDLIKQSIERYGDQIAVACSFGKDSIVVLHMALKVDPNIKVVFCNTGVEFPETLEYKEKLKKEWNLNLIETKPIKTYWECKKEYGLPSIRGKGTKRTPKCCIYCKEKPAFNEYKKQGIIAVLTGLTAAESRQRRMLIMRMDNKEAIGFCGQRYYAKSQGLWKIHPIAYWTVQDVWNYLYNNDIPINPVYTKWHGIYNRVGCLPCSSYKNWDKKTGSNAPEIIRNGEKGMTADSKIFLVKDPIDEGSDSVGNHLWSFDSISGYVEISPSDLEIINDALREYNFAHFETSNLSQVFYNNKFETLKALLKKLESLT